ncbi:MAG: DUF2806 domain-containing protein [Nostoc sp. NMS2]|uniref:DUF2806 domain-containing protein n=1 Tax=Nostoc sp. NMS2 TaxID=2815389 RepID=UPI0025EF1448|nr:DUF2806 domain-containing protein [Nostoc sp. NMS2]MBN3989266.1 DUF2806 domain-containing protein [Nostoc sp. NMS2]
MEQEDSNRGLIEIAQDAVTDLITGSSIPAPIKRNAFKAFAQLCTAAIDIPVAYFEGISAEKRAETQGRLKIINTGADQIATQMDVDPEFARVAVKKYGQKIIREQVNLNKISEIAAGQIQQEALLKLKPDAATEVPVINEDWLNNFEKQASQKSTEEMQLLFGRILAGEIQKPSSFSIKTVNLLGELDRAVAALFLKLCSLCVCLKVRDSYLDARVPSLGRNAASNALRDYGLSFDQLNILQEHNLIISDYNSYFDYKISIAGGIIDGSYQVGLPLLYQNKYYVWLPVAERPKDQVFNLHGVALSKSGKELLRIVDIQPSENYTTALTDYFTRQGLQMLEMKVDDGSL